MNLQDQLNGILQDLSKADVETTLILGAVLLLIAGLITQKTAVLKVVFFSVILFAFSFSIDQGEEGTLLSESLIANRTLVSFTSLFVLLTSLVLLFPRKKHVVEFYFFVLALLIGSVFMIKANSILVVYLSIELVSFTSYILTSFAFKRQSHEAAIKYLLFGAISSAVMLVGLGLVYGTTGTFLISDWGVGQFDSILPQLGVLFFIFGTLFKSSIFPFHIWTPATYQSAPIDAVALFSVIPKLAGLILLNRVVIQLGFNYDDWLMGVLLVLGMSTIVVGTLGALSQSNTRRLISFGSVAHSGFLMILVLDPQGNPDVFWFYGVIYAVMNFGAFYLVDAFEAQSIYLNREYEGARPNVWVGGVFIIILVSLVGLPPMGGFSAKLLLFSSMWNMYLQSNTLLILIYFLLAVFATVASLFFYLRIPYFQFVHPKVKNERPSIEFSLSMKIIATIFAVMLLLSFFAPKLLVMMQQMLNNVHE